MFRKMSKYLVLISCMIFAFFLFKGVEISATKGDAVLLTNKAGGETSIVVGSGGKENTYYSSNSANLVFEVTDYNAWTGDTFVKWRIVNPAGKATEWFGNINDSSVRYPDNNGKFTIANFLSLSYSAKDNADECTNGCDRTTIAPGATYFVDIKYYAQVLWPSHQKKKDETLKIIVSSATPEVNINYDSSKSEYTVDAKFNSGTAGLITKVEYFISSSSVTVNKYTEFQSFYSSNGGKSLTVKPATTFQGTISGGTSDYEIYVAVTTINGDIKIKSLKVQGGNVDGVEDSNKEETTEQNNQDTSTGIFDFGFGEMILLILVIVLVVSCALIIAQKIVDHKKRLY